MRSAKQKGKYAAIRTDTEQMKNFIRKQQASGKKLHLSFEISVESGHRQDTLTDSTATVK